jgi:tRNA pseudouridine-54 N-methylase
VQVKIAEKRPYTDECVKRRLNIGFMTSRENRACAKVRPVLQTAPQPTHIVRVLGDAIRTTRTNVRGVVTHANDSEEEESQEGPCEEEGQEGKEEEEIAALTRST